jgi:hypothetical protein
VATIKGGKIVARDGKIVGEPNGRYWPRDPNHTAAYFEWFDPSDHEQTPIVPGRVQSAQC